MKKENRINHYIDLHAHLDGCISVEIAKKLAALQQITLPAKTDKELTALLSVPDSCQDLNDFLKCFELPLSLLQTEKALEDAVYLVLSEMHKDGSDLRRTSICTTASHSEGNDPGKMLFNLAMRG